MKNVIGKIFSGEIDEDAHFEFVKFSRGTFNNRHLIYSKKQKDKWVIKTGSEFANFFVRRVLENSSGEIKVKGIIVSTQDLDVDCEFPIDRVKKFMGIKHLVIECSTDRNKIISLMKKYPRAFYALSFSAQGYELKVKAKSPKSGKPGSSSKGKEESKADFCILKTSDKEIIKDLFFDFPEFNEIKVSHTIEINDIELPKDTKTPEEMREKAIRRGIITRIVEVDGRKEVEEKSFEV